MADKSVLARPYARAVFELARQGNDLEAWGQGLHVLAAVASDKDVQAIMTHPDVSDEQRQAFFTSFLDEQATDQHHFVSVLTENGRLNLMPEICEQFQMHRDQYEKLSNVSVTSAFTINDAQQQSLQAALSKRFDRQITLSQQTDPTLIGGMIIRAGDLVIDGSIHGKLKRLRAKLKSQTIGE